MVTRTWSRNTRHASQPARWARIRSASASDNAPSRWSVINSSASAQLIASNRRVVSGSGIEVLLQGAAHGHAGAMQERPLVHIRYSQHLAYLRPGPALQVAQRHHLALRR